VEIAEFLVVLREPGMIYDLLKWLGGKRRMQSRQAQHSFGGFWNLQVMAGVGIDCISEFNGT
jgi:hypothetical protein